MMLVPGIVHRHIPALLRATPCLVQQLDCKVTAVVSTSYSTESDMFLPNTPPFIFEDNLDVRDSHSKTRLYFIFGYGTVSCFEQKIKEFHSIARIKRGRTVGRPRHKREIYSRD